MFHRVSEDIPLYDILNEFQKGHSHIAVVYKDLNGRKEALKNGKEGETSVFKDDCKMQGGQSEAPLKNGVCIRCIFFPSTSSRSIPDKLWRYHCNFFYMLSSSTSSRDVFSNDSNLIIYG